MTERASWDETWMALADAMARRSACERRQVGAVLVSPTNVILATGYNGPPASHRTATCGTCPRNLTAKAGIGVGPGYEECFSLHAELNAILRSDASARANGAIYVTSAICITCARMIAGAGVVRAVHRVEERDAHRLPEESERLMRACGIEVVRWI